MDHSGYSDSFLKTILTTTRTIALVGASANPARPSYGVMQFLLQRGFQVVPINPGLAGQALHGQAVLGRLADLAAPIDMVDVFRASEALPGLVDEMLAMKHKPKVLWGQLNVFDAPAAARAETAGIQVVMNRCPVIEMHRLGL